MTEYPDHLAIARKLLEQQGEINALTERAETAEAERDRLKARSDFLREMLTLLSVSYVPTDQVLRWLDRPEPPSAALLAAPGFPLPIRADGTHYYVSTGCGCTGDNLMPDGRTGHEYCQGMTGFQGAKRGGRAKCCGAPCQCSCHQDERCSTCGTRVEPLGMVLHFRAEHATPEDLAESSTEDSCRVVEVDGGPIRIHGSGEFTAEDTAAMGEVVATAKKLMATLPPGPLEFECPRCQAVPGQLCRRESGIGGHAPHDERRALAVAAVAGPATGREDVPLAREATPEEAARMLANLAQSGVETPGCDCGHDGMGASWHRDDCYWRAAL